MQYLPLANELKMPALGYGCAAIEQFQADSKYVTQTITTALNLGYRHLDTATMYGNEKNVGAAIRQSGVPRSEIFLVTKLHTTDMSFDAALRAAERSLKKLQTDYIDLYLIHWPLREQYLEAWRALERLYEQGLAKAIGGSNFAIRHFEGIAAKGNIQPMSDQVEFNPYLQQRALREYCGQHKIVLTAWSPLGTGAWSQVKLEDKPLRDPAILALSQKYQKSPAQIILRWLVDIGVSAIPKSENPQRMAENLDIFDFRLEQADIQAIAAMDKNFSLSASYEGGNRELYNRI